MNQHADQQTQFLDTSTPVAFHQWDDLLRLQVDLFFPRELEFLRGLAAWQSARSVLDVGCGNGYYLSRLQERFPEKRYCGLDVSAELIGEAESRHGNAGADFVGGDFFAFAPPRRFDIVIMRFVVQHLTDFAAILDKAGAVLTPQGRLVIIEPDLSQSCNRPATPVFRDLLESFERVRRAGGRIRGRFDELHDTAAGSGWRVVSDKCSVVSTPNPSRHGGLLGIYAHWIDLCEGSALFSFPFDAARAELADWARDDEAVSEVALRFLVLGRRADS